ncbi:MAG: EpsG family protein [Oscillospiraceae bacterium]|nr:EpsG family protein [Oscillospiraceae bacterium]
MQPLSVRMYFFLFAAVSIGSSWLAQRFPLRRRSLLRNEVPNPLGVLPPMVLLVWFSGMRRGVGDTPYYVHSYLRYWVEGAPKPQWQFGEVFLNWVYYFEAHTKPIGMYGQWIILIMAIFFLVPTVLVLYRYAESLSTALFFLIATGTLAYSMNGIRQFAAAGVLLLGSHFFFGKRLIRSFLGFLPFVLLAYLIHKSAPIMIPVFFLVRFRAFSWMSYTMIVGAVGAVLFARLLMPGFLDMLRGSDYSVYAETGWFEETHGSSLLRLLIAATPLVFAYFYRRQFGAMGKSGDILINLTFLHVAILTLSLYNWIFARLSIYFYVYYILFLDRVFAYLRQQYGSPNVATVLGCVLYTVWGWRESSGGFDEMLNFHLPGYTVPDIPIPDVFG